jgi:hypothetical protein
MRAFNFPATCFAATMLGRYGFAVFWRNVKDVSSLRRLAFDGLAHVPFVQTQMLLVPGC